jgi:hypothetical protein
VKGFKNCFIPSAVDGTDGDKLWNVSSEEGGNVRCESEEDEDGDSDTVHISWTLFVQLSTLHKVARPSEVHM